METECLHFQTDDPSDGLGLLRQYVVSETYHRHGHDFYELFFVLNGQALHDVNDHHLVLDTGSLVLIRPGDVHSYRFLNTYTFDFINVAFDRRFFEEAASWLELPTETVDGAPLPPQTRLTGYEYTETRRKLLALNAMTPGLARRRTFRGLLPELLLCLAGEERDAASTTLPAWFSALLADLDRPEAFLAGLDYVLRHTNYSQEHVTRTFQRYLQMPPTAYINTKRLAYAAELLLAGAPSMLEVCNQAGFNNLSHFYHLFRAHFGCAPGQFAARYRAGRPAEQVTHSTE